MNRHSNIAPQRTFETGIAHTHEECGACDGRGSWLEGVRWAGEPYGEQVEVICHCCDGEGEIELDAPECPGCDGVIVDGLCLDCELVFAAMAGAEKRAST